MMFMNNLLLRWKISQQQTFLYSDSLVGVETERMRLQSPLGMKKSTGNEKETDKVDSLDFRNSNPLFVQWRPSGGLNRRNLTSTCAAEAFLLFMQIQKTPTNKQNEKTTTKNNQTKIEIILQTNKYTNKPRKNKQSN